MTTCHQLSDRMPEVSRGSLRWTAAEERHLARCEACRLEWSLVRRVARLGAAVELGIDSAAIADRVLLRLRTAGVAGARRRVWLVGALAAAASVVVLLWGRGIPSTSHPVAVVPESVTVAQSLPASPEPMTAPTVSPSTASAGLSVPELDDLSADQLRMVMESLDRPFRPDELLESPGDLESRDLEVGFSS